MTRHRTSMTKALTALAVLLPTWATAGSASANTIERIRVTEAADRTVVEIHATAKPTFTVFKLTDPPRLFVDVLGGDVGRLEPTMAVPNGVLERIHALQYEGDVGPVGRIVVEFARDTSYDIKTQGSVIRLLVDGAGRTAPDLRLKEAEAEAKRIEAEIARERKLLTELKSARVTEERLRQDARAAREQEEALAAEIAKARAEAQGLSEQLRQQAETLTGELEDLKRTRDLEQEKAEALQRAVRAEAARKAAIEDERKRAEELKTAAEEALAHEQARLSAMKAATKRAAEERKAVEAAAAAERERAAAEQRVAEAREHGTKAELAKLERELAARDAELAKTRADAEATRRSLEEARLAQAQAEARLRDANDRKLELERQRLAATEEALKREKERTRALEEAMARRDEQVDASREAQDLAARSEAAQRKLAELEGQLGELRQAKKQADEQAGVEQARIAMLKSQLEAERKQVEEAKAEAARARAEAREAKAQAEAAPAAAPAPVRETPIAATPAPAKAGTAVVTDVRFKDAGEQAQVRIKLTSAADYQVVKRGPQRLELKLRGATIARELERSLDTSDFSGPVKLVSSFRSADEPGTVRVVVDLKERADSDVTREGDELVWAFSDLKRSAGADLPVPTTQRPGHRTPPGVRAWPGLVAAEGGAVAVKAGGEGSARTLSSRRSRQKRKYTGKKINLTIKDADIQHVLTFLAKEGGVNIVASDTVRGNVTFHLENIPWDLALDMILKTQGYDYVKESGVYRVAPAVDIQKEFEQELKRKQTIEELKPMVVRFVTVNYADLAEVANHVKTVLSKNGTVSADSSTSTLIVKDTQEHVDAAEDIVRRLDVQLPQVLIEARIVEASTSFSRDLGIQWGGNFTMSPAFGNPTGLAFPSIVGISGGADDGAAPTGGLLASSPNFAVNLPAAAGAGAGGALGLTLGSLGGAANLNLRLSAAEDEGQVKIISAPKILTIDGKSATIRQGVSIPISVVSANGVNTQFFNAELKLEVQTNTSPDGNIRLDLEITKNEPDFGRTSAQGAPTIAKKEARTSLLVRDGDTTVIGGIYTRNTGRSKAKVPFLSKIPILGWFFQSSRVTDDRSELLIFITPRIANRRASLVDGGAP